MAFRSESKGRRGNASTETSNLNRRLRNIWERDDKDYGVDIEDENELVDRFETTMRMTEENINRVVSDIRRSKTVDYCFLVDATSSMQPHIDGVRESVRKVVDALVQSQKIQSGIEKLRFAVVAYRDLTDDVPFELFEFSANPEMCVNFCRHLVAKGGGDIPEDVFGGLEAATQLRWSDEAGTRIIFHMADAPCHGRRYHSQSLGDSHPGGDPKNRTEVGLFAEMKRLDIDYYFGKINDSTDQMIELFEAAYGRPITAFDVQSIRNIAESVISSITTSVDVNVERTKLGTTHMKVRNFQLELAEPNWDKTPVQDGTYLEHKLPRCMKDVENGVQLKEKTINSVRVKIANKPFAEGSERIAYYGQDLFQGYNNYNGGQGFQQRSAEASCVTEIVLKEYKFLGHKQNALERYKTASEAQTVAFFLADQFNRRTAGLGETMQIKFLKLRTLILQPKRNQLRVMSCERKYYGSGDFVKFTNNCDYSMQQTASKVQKYGIDAGILDVVMAFSHWTYHYSNRFLMVVDLQGKICSASGNTGSKKVLMTDPSIHCLDTTRFAPLNLGKPGMQAFLGGHRCSSLCRRLGLPDAVGRR